MSPLSFLYGEPKAKPAYTNHQLQSTFMRLPGELRNLIYHYAIINDDPSKRTELRTLQHPGGLLATCKRFEKEGLAYYLPYEKITFTILLDLHGKVHCRYDARVKRWMTRRFCNPPVQDVLFRIQHPALKITGPPAPGSGLSGIKIPDTTIDFLSVVGKSGVKVVFQQKPRPCCTSPTLPN